MPEGNDETLKTVATITELAGQRAENLFANCRLCCAESILLVVNHGLGGSLADEAAVSLAAGFCGGVGEAGCICGALAGATMGLGLFLAPNLKGGLPEKRFRELNQRLHDRFLEQAGSACCRTLIKGFDRHSRARKDFCLGLTGLGARLAVDFLLKERPALLAVVDLDFLQQRDSRLAGLFKSFSG